MNAIITVVGKDGKGIIAAVSAKCAAVGANIVEISQSVLKEYFAMIMLIDISELDKLPFEGVLTENLNIVLQFASCNSTWNRGAWGGK